MIPVPCWTLFGSLTVFRAPALKMISRLTKLLRTVIDGHRQSHGFAEIRRKGYGEYECEYESFTECTEHLSTDWSEVFQTRANWGWFWNESGQMACVASCEEDVLLLCRKYDISRPTVHEVMKDTEKLNKTFESRSISLMLEVRLVTALANHSCLLPENPLNAEVQVNSLLPYLSSPCRWVRSLACSLLRVFTLGLNPNGQHFETQGKKINNVYKYCTFWYWSKKLKWYEGTFFRCIIYHEQ